MSAQPNSGARSYDEVPYRGKPFRQTHPENLATIAHLLSVPSPDIHTARVLELGCCDGGNLLPMAVDFPEAKFVGIDYSKVQIDLGRRAVAQLGVSNLDLRDISILDIKDNFGEFDYIISHGVFSWVPDEVAHKMLDICAKHLSPDGIAYISYNTYPGWYMRAAVRDMMRYHALRFESAARRIEEARLMLGWVAQNAHGFNAEAYGKALKNEAELLAPCPDHYLYHEHLEDHSRPYYFHEFIAKAQDRGLEFLAESRLGAMAVTNYNEKQQQTLGAIATNIIELEQFMDFLRNRSFRETLLHRAGRSPQYEIAPERLQSMHIMGLARTDGSVVDVRPDKPVRFEGPGKVPVTTTTPILKAAMVCLINSFPLPLHFEALLEKARHQLARSDLATAPLQKDRHQLAAGLLKIYMSADLLELTIAPPRFTINAPTRPLVSKAARHMLEDAAGDLVVTRRHDLVRITPEQRGVLALLDGQHDAISIAAALQTSAESVNAIIHQIERMAMIAD